MMVQGVEPRDLDLAAALHLLEEHSRADAHPGGLKSSASQSSGIASHPLQMARTSPSVPNVSCVPDRTQEICKQQLILKARPD